MTASLHSTRPRGATPIAGAAVDWRLRYAALAVAVSLASCGGGGGTETPVPSPPGGGGGGNVSVSGKVTFDSVPPQSPRGLNYGGITRAPIRGATIQLIDASGAVVGSTVSNALGDYTLSGNASGQVSVRVLAELKGTNYNFTVRDNTDGGAMWGMQSSSFAAGAGVTQDVHATSGWNGTSYTASQRVAGPFAILDIAYLAKEKITSVAPTQDFASLKIFWSSNNVPSGGNLRDGAIGTSFFITGLPSTDPDAAALGISPSDRSLFILGAENVDTDEYDTAVIAHEIGHYLQSVISRDDSVGGPHGPDDLLDMRVAFSEGWGNAWSGMVRDNPVYFDSQGARQASGFQYSVATAPATQGWYSEGTVEYLLWNYYSDTRIAFGGIYAALADMSDSPYLSSIFSFNEALRVARPSVATTINSSAVAAGVNGTDGYGTGETNSGSITGVLPVYEEHNVSLGAATTHCVTREAGSPNKLGNFVYVKFTASGVRTVSVQRSANTVQRTDPDLKVITSQGQTFQSRAETDNTDSIPNLSLTAGTHVLVIDDYFLRDSGATGQRCFDVRIN